MTAEVVRVVRELQRAFEPQTSPEIPVVTAAEIRLTQPFIVNMGTVGELKPKPADHVVTVSFGSDLTERFELAVINVGSLNEPVWIMYVNARDEQLADYGARELGKAAARLRPDTVGRIGSEKSWAMVGKAHGEVKISSEKPDLPLVDFETSPDREWLEETLGQGCLTIGYQPITSKGPEGKPKYMGITNQSKNILTLSENLVIVDDVASTGATFNAARLITAMARGKEVLSGIQTASEAGVIIPEPIMQLIERGLNVSSLAGAIKRGQGISQELLGILEQHIKLSRMLKLVKDLGMGESGAWVAAQAWQDFQADITQMVKASDMPAADQLALAEKIIKIREGLPDVRMVCLAQEFEYGKDRSVPAMPKGVEAFFRIPVLFELSPSFSP